MTLSYGPYYYLGIYYTLVYTLCIRSTPVQVQTKIGVIICEVGKEILVRSCSLKQKYIHALMGLWEARFEAAINQAPKLLDYCTECDRLNTPQQSLDAFYYLGT